METARGAVIAPLDAAHHDDARCCARTLVQAPLDGLAGTGQIDVLVRAAAAARPVDAYRGSFVSGRACTASTATGVGFPLSHRHPDTPAPAPRTRPWALAFHRVDVLGEEDLEALEQPVGTGGEVPVLPALGALAAASPPLQL